MTIEKNITKQTSTGRTVSFDPETKTVTILKDGAPVYHSKALDIAELEIAEPRPLWPRFIRVDDVVYRFNDIEFENKSEAYEEIIRRISTPTRDYIVFCDSSKDHAPISSYLEEIKAVDGLPVSQEERENLKRALEHYYIIYNNEIKYIF